MKKKILFIVNPHSGVDRVKSIQALIEAGIDSNKFDVAIAHTKNAGHGTELAREAAAAGTDIVVAVGGDGSVNDVVKGIYGTQTKLGIVPKGSGNGLARSLKIPLDAAAAIDAINNANAITIDVGTANNIVFAANIGVGFDAQVAKEFAKSKRRGLAAYSWIVTKLLWTYKAQEWDIEVDGTSYREKCFMLNVANAKQFGYNFKIAPLADLQDGQFDIILVRNFPKLLGLFIVARAFRGTLLKSRYVTFLRGSHVKISHQNLQMMQADGDTHACENSLEVNLKPAAISIIVP